MSWIQENQRQGLMLISRCMQKPGSWITERIADGNLSESILTLFQEKDTQDNSSHTFSQALADLQSMLNLYSQKMPEEIQKDLARQYVRWTRVETNTMTAANPPTPFNQKSSRVSDAFGKLLIRLISRELKSNCAFNILFPSSFTIFSIFPLKAKGSAMSSNTITPSVMPAILNTFFMC